MKNYLLVVIASLLLLSSCSDNTTEPTQSYDIWPLKVGNYWVYQTTQYTPDGSILDQTVNTYKVVEEVTINSQKAYIIQINPDSLYNDYLEPIFKNEQGINGFTYLRDTFHLVYKNPVSDNETYLVQGATCKVNFVNLPKQILNLKTESIKYTFTSTIPEDQHKFEIYFSKDVGRAYIIYYKLEYDAYYPFEISELIAYHLE